MLVPQLRSVTEASGDWAGSGGVEAQLDTLKWRVDDRNSLPILSITGEDPEHVLGYIVAVFTDVQVSASACMMRQQPDLLNNDETLHGSSRGAHLLHLGSRAPDKVRDSFHACLESIVGAPTQGHHEDGAIFKICPSSRILGLTRVQIA